MLTILLNLPKKCVNSLDSRHINMCTSLTHKVLALCFFGQGKVNKVSREDLKLLWTLSQECELIPDWAGLFITSCHKARTHDRGKISMGGMISLLIQALLDDISALSSSGSKDPPLGGFVYDITWLRNNR